jgi:hypothetical protein
METVFKKGDRVFDYTYGWGAVEEVDSSVCVKFDSCTNTRVRYWGVLLRDLSFTEYKLAGFSQNREDINPEYFGWDNPVLSRKEVFKIIDDAVNSNRGKSDIFFISKIKENLRELAFVNADKKLKQQDNA